MSTQNDSLAHEVINKLTNGQIDSASILCFSSPQNAQIRQRLKVGYLHNYQISHTYNDKNLKTILKHFFFLLENIFQFISMAC